MVMSKQQQAPGELELVREFVNTLDIEEGTERLAGASALAGWLAERGLAAPRVRAGRADLRRAFEVREALRALLLAHNGGDNASPEVHRTLERAADRARLRLRFDDHDIAGLEPEAGGVDGALGRLLGIVHASMATGSWERLKACRDDACKWAFYDHTKNRSGAWCNMAVCGNRAKARAYRERSRRPHH
jgi:predicted RNA-binding Zn ribbon-like protein